MSLLQIRNLRTHFKTPHGTVRAVDDVSLDIGPGDVLGIVGESGCGKSVLSLSILQLLPMPPAFFAAGQIIFEGRNLLQATAEEVRKMRGNRGIDFLRRKRSRERTLARARLGLWNNEPVDPEQQVLRREEIDTLLGVFQTLPSKDRELILMKDVDGLSVEEIAEILEVPSGTVKSRLHRARERLLRTARSGR